jgi:VWFA-related protein
MNNAVLLVALVLAQAGDRPAETRFLSAAITSARGEPLGGVMREELAVIENGVARPVTSVERDTRPLSLAVLVDTSAAVQNSYRPSIVPAVLALLSQLPDGSQYTLWTTGDRPTRVSEAGSDRAVAKNALERIAPQGGSMLLETIVEAAQALRKQEGQRRAMVVVSAFGPEFSSRDRRQVVEDALASGLEVFSAALIDEGSGADREMRLNYEQTLTELASKTGGLHERLLSSLAVDNALRKIAKDLGSRYRIGYATMPEIKKRKIEVKVARPDVRVRVGQPRGEKS